MKKKLLILPLITLLAVPGCKNNTNGNKKGDVVNEAVLRANTKEIKKSIFSDFELKEKSLPVANATSYTISNGFYVIKDSTNTHFYSPLIESVVATISNSDDYYTYTSDVAGSYLVYTNENGASVVDALGNKLVEDSKRTYSSLSITSGINSKGIYYADVAFDDTHLYFHYSDKGVATVHSTEIGDDYGSGTTVQGLDYVLLDDFGHPGYQRIKNSSRYIIFDNKGNEISSFTDPHADASFFVGDYLIYQNSVKLDNNNNNYDYISETGERYSLETYRINYLNAKKEAIDVSYLLSTGSNDIHSFRNAKGIYAYAYANMRTISDKKILSSTLETYIVDGNGNLHDNVTGINLGAFERIGNNFYNTENQTIYDGNLNELSILTNMNPNKIDNAEMIICEVEGLYGAVNQKGQVVLPFQYDAIITTYISNNKALVFDDGVTKIVEFDVNKATYKDFKTYDTNTFSYFGCGIYKIGDQFFNLIDGELDTLLFEEDYHMVATKTISYAINTAKIFTLQGNASTTVYGSGTITITR